MRTHSIALSAAAIMALVATSAEARTAFGGNRAGGSAASERPAESPSIIAAVAAMLNFGVSAKAVAGADAPRSTAPRTEQCEEEKKRAAAAKAADTRRTAQLDKPKARGGEQLYLAF